MKLHCAPLSLFLCSIGAAQARVSSHNTVMDVKEDANWSLDNEIGVRIQNSRNSRCVDLSGTRISAGLCARAARWDIREIRRSTTIYTIKASGTDNCLGMDKRNRIMVSKCNDTNLRANNQKWTMTNGQIQNTERNQCMEVDGHQVKLAACSRNNSNRNQRFTTPGAKREQTNNIKPVSDSSKCMKVRNSDIETGSCKSSSWEFKPSAGTFRYNGGSMCLDATNGFDGAATINKCDNSNSQKWEELSNPNRIRSEFTKQCLKLNDTTKKFNLRTCGTGEQFQFTYERPNAIEVKNVE